MALIGYARISTTEQHLHLQQDALSAAGCLKIFTEKASGKVTKRPQLELMMSFVRSGDTVVIHSMDRLGRNLDDLRRIVQTLTHLETSICIDDLSLNSSSLTSL
jgi:DNA invertase Pin-like site-specific DNA recombinase